MTPSEIEMFENFFSESFKEGMVNRELRLSDQELDYIKNNYPRVSFRSCDKTDYIDEKKWYLVELI